MKEVSLWKGFMLTEWKVKLRFVLMMKKIVEIELSKVKGKVVEGSVLIKKNGNFAVDEAETRLKRAEISQLQNELFGDD